MPHGPIHDHDRIAAMARHGCPNSIIAKRLGCSERTVRRVLAAEGLNYTTNALVGTPDEYWLYHLLDGLGFTPGMIAHRFGKSRRAIIEALRKPIKTPPPGNGGSGR